VLIQNGKAKAARRLLALSQRVRLMLENRWKDVGECAREWVWPADNKDEPIDHDSLKIQHKTALKLTRSAPSKSIRFGTRSSRDCVNAAAMCGHSPGLLGIQILRCHSGTFIVHPS
jgi:hypothetical protein